MLPALFYLLFLAISLLVLVWVNRQILEQIIYLLSHFTRSAHVAVGIYFLIVCPGIYVHETAHWIVALLLGMRPSAFSVWPEIFGNSIRLGYVQMQRSDPFSESLVGVAPLAVGMFLITWISQRIFAIDSLIDSFLSVGWQGAFLQLRHTLFRLDQLLWLYLLFALANGMMLSASDRRPVRPILGFFLFAALTFVTVGLPSGPIESLMSAIFPALEALAMSFLLIIFVDIIVSVTIGFLTLLASPLR